MKAEYHMCKKCRKAVQGKEGWSDIDKRWAKEGTSFNDPPFIHCPGKLYHDFKKAITDRELPLVIKRIESQLNIPFKVRLILDIEPKLTRILGKDKVPEWCPNKK